MLWEYCKILKDKQFNKVINLFKVGISSPSLPCLLCFSPRDIDSILDAGEIESNDYEEESLSDQCGKDDLKDKSAVV